MALRPGGKKAAKPATKTKAPATTETGLPEAPQDRVTSAGPAVETPPPDRTQAEAPAPDVATLSQKAAEAASEPDIELVEDRAPDMAPRANDNEILALIDNVDVGRLMGLPIDFDPDSFKKLVAAIPRIVGLPTEHDIRLVADEILKWTPDLVRSHTFFVLAVDELKTRLEAWVESECDRLYREARNWYEKAKDNSMVGAILEKPTKPEKSDIRKTVKSSSHYLRYSSTLNRLKYWRQWTYRLGIKSQEMKAMMAMSINKSSLRQPEAWMGNHQSGSGPQAPVQVAEPETLNFENLKARLTAPPDPKAAAHVELPAPAPAAKPEALPPPSTETQEKAASAPTPAPAPEAKPKKRAKKEPTATAAPATEAGPQPKVEEPPQVPTPSPSGKKPIDPTLRSVYPWMEKYPDLSLSKCDVCQTLTLLSGEHVFSMTGTPHKETCRSPLTRSTAAVIPVEHDIDLENAAAAPQGVEVEVPAILDDDIADPFADPGPSTGQPASAPVHSSTTHGASPTQGIVPDDDIEFDPDAEFGV